jgi:hypothetical protein
MSCQNRSNAVLSTYTGNKGVEPLVNAAQYADGAQYDCDKLKVPRSGETKAPAL